MSWFGIRRSYKFCSALNSPSFATDGAALAYRKIKREQITASRSTANTRKSFPALPVYHTNTHSTNTVKFCFYECMLATVSQSTATHAHNANEVKRKIKTSRQCITVGLSAHNTFMRIQRTKAFLLLLLPHYLPISAKILFPPLAVAFELIFFSFSIFILLLMFSIEYRSVYTKRFIFAIWSN